MASHRAKSTSDFVYKLKIVEEEADASLFFLELIKEINSDTNFIGEMIDYLKKETKFFLW